MNTIRRYKIYGLAFIIPTVLLAIVYATRGVYPISNNSVLVLDLNAQYVYYYEAFRDAFYSNKSLLYSFSRTLGGEMVGIYAYYLASPFTFLILLFPKKLITEAVLAMILCKVGCAGLSFFIYLKVTKFAKNHNALIFSTLYALMGYVIVQTMNPMWLDAVLLLPLLIMAVQKLVDEGKYILYICLLTITFISNFYIGYMVGIFLAIYFLCYIFGLTSLENKEIKIVRRMILFTISSITSVLMSLWLIIPTYLALKMGKFTFTNPDFMPEQQIDLFDLFAKALPLSYDSVDYPGLPFIYCGLMTVLLIVLYFLNDAIRPKEKIASVIFMFIVVASFTISTVDIALHGFQAPNWLNYRYSFILSFYMVSIAYDSFVNLKNISGKTIAKASLIIVLLIALTGRNGYEFIEPEITIWFSYTALMIYAILLYLIKSNKVMSQKKALTIILVSVLVTELLLNTMHQMYSADVEVSYSSRTSYREYFEKLYPAVDYVKERDDNFYRMDSLMRRAVNDPLALGIYGLSNSSSILNERVINTLKKLGISSKDHWTKYKGTTLISDSLLGFKYVIANEETPMKFSQYPEIYEDNGVKVYENPYALPIMFVANEDLKKVKLISNDPFINQNKLLSAIIGEKVAYFKKLEIKEEIFENVRSKKMSGCVKYTPVNEDKDAHIEYIIEPIKDNPMYLYIYSEYPRVINLWKDNEFVDTFFENNSTCIMPLGVGNEEMISLKTSLTDEEYYLGKTMFYYLDMDVFEKAREIIFEKEVSINKQKETYIEAKVTADDGDVLYTSIPYEKGWQVSINDEKVETYMTIDALMAIDLVEGEQTVVFKFIPSGLRVGLTISILTLVMFIVFITYSGLRRKKRKVINSDNIELIEAIENNDTDEKDIRDEKGEEQ